MKPLVPYPGASKPWKSIHIVCGKEVTPAYNNVRTGHSGCKYCIGNIVDEKKAREFFIANGLLPIEPYKNALSKWKSIHQRCGREVSPQYNSVQQGQGGCQYCGGNLPISAKNAKKFFLEKGYTPQEKFAGAKNGWKSIHQKCGKIVFPTYSTLQQGGGGCKFCARVYVEPADAIKLFNSRGLEPIDNYQNSATPWRSIHTQCGRVVSPSYASIYSGQGGCAYCSGNKVDENEAKKLFIKVGLIPQVPFPGAKIGWKSIHAECGREVFPKYSNVLDGSRGCKECSNNYVNPEAAIEVFRSADLEPLEPYPGAGRGWRSIHTVCGREVAPHWGYVRKFLSGCKYCAGNAVTEEDAVAILLNKGFEPKVPYPGSQVPWLMVHKKCGEEVKPRLNSLRFNGGDGDGCVKCSDSTFNFLKPALIYLITHPTLGAHKVGISGATKSRLKQHQREGWETYKQLTLDTGQQAYVIEQGVFEWLEETFGLTPFLSKQSMPQGGFTETVDASEIDLPTIWAKVEELSEKRIKKGH